MFVLLGMYHWQCIQVKVLIGVNENALFGILRQAAVQSLDLGSPVLESTLRPRDGGSHSARKQGAWRRTAYPSVVSSRQTFKMAAQIEMEVIQ